LLRRGQAERDQAPDGLAFRRKALLEAVVGDPFCLIGAKSEEPLYRELGAVGWHIQDMLDFQREIKNNT
jgi:hypothetical protein